MVSPRSKFGPSLNTISQMSPIVKKVNFLFYIINKTVLALKSSKRFQEYIFSCSISVNERKKLSANKAAVVQGISQIINTKATHAFCNI